MRQVGFAIRGAIICLAFLTVTANAWADTVTLVWDPSPDPSVTGYYVYVGAEPGVYDHRYDVGNTTSFVYLDGAVDRRYYFAVAAYVPGPLLSSLSNEVSWLSNNSLPTLVDPGPQYSIVGQPVVVQLAATDPDGQLLEYSASDIPPGLTLEPATGTVAGTPTIAGHYSVTVSVTDGAAFATQMFSWTVAEAASVDSTPPLVTITLAPPTSLDRFGTSSTSVILGGTATDDGQVVRVEWVNDRGGSGSATGTTTWIAGITLYPGRNDIEVSAVDEAGNRGTAFISIFQQQ